MTDLHRQLQESFGLDDFRPSQREVIEDVLRGRDVLCVMPTGAGKSLCYQLPAVAQGGLTLVISPLISLMADQVQQLRDEELASELLNSSQTPAQQREVIERIERGFQGLLYVAPERFSSPAFQSLLQRLRPKLLAIDEEHCISQWGHDFRPEYSQLDEIRRKLGSPTTIALTATATEDVRGDIVQGLALRDPSIVVTGFDRPNLSYQCQRMTKSIAKQQELLRRLRACDESAIVYCGTRKNVEEVAAFLARALNGRTVVAYHAGMDAPSRNASHERFMETSRAIAVATNAFGMGINKPDIRLVVHYNVPGTLEQYYQEAGRAGRDGRPADAVLLFSYQDRILQEFFIGKIGEDRASEDQQFVARLKQRATEKLDLMLSYAQTHRCRRQQILEYFGDETEAQDCRCDVCAQAHGESPGSSLPGTGGTVVIPDELVTLVRQILSAVARLRGKFGVGGIAEVLTGVRSERTERWQLDQLSVFGRLNRFPTKRMIAMVHRVIESGLARQKDVGTPGKPIYVVELTASGIAVMKGAQPPPASLIDLVPRQGTRASGTRATRDAQPEIDDQPIDPDTVQRFERLRAARLQLARDRQLPPYCICHDSTLKLIARFAPSDVQTLERIKGMGPYKVKMYGDALLTALREA
jgi:ATP-dependent DNA helicase RecQ